MYYSNRKIIRVQGQDHFMMQDKVIVEHEVDIFYDECCLGTYSCTNKELRELAIGLAFSKGYAIVEDMKINMHGNQIHLITSKEQPDSLANGNLEQVRDDGKELRIEASDILRCMRDLREASGLFMETGGTHNGAWVYRGNLVDITEDISRNCMVDKLIGKALNHAYDWKELCILLSCRVSKGIMHKLSMAGIPIVVSMSAVMDTSIEMAKITGTTLVGFTRYNRMNIYQGDGILLGVHDDQR